MVQHVETKMVLWYGTTTGDGDSRQTEPNSDWRGSNDEEGAVIRSRRGPRRSERTYSWSDKEEFDGRDEERRSVGDIRIGDGSEDR